SSEGRHPCGSDESGMEDLEGLRGTVVCPDVMAVALSTIAPLSAQSESRVRVPESERGGTARSQRATVLIVDDNPGDRELYSELIGGLELRIREAASADEALD